MSFGAAEIRHRQEFFRAIVEIFAGEPRPFQGADSHQVLQCSACRLSLWAYNPTSGDAIAFVAVGMLDLGERLPPEVHYLTRSKHPWVTLSPDVPAFEEHGDRGMAGGRRAHRDRACEVTQVTQWGFGDA